MWLPEGWWAGVAEEIPDAQARLPLMRQVLIASGFAAYAAGINPRALTDDELAAVTQTGDYRLIHIRRAAACTGPSGPGDLAWVWPASTMALLLWLWLRRKR